jgi:hypothetical protein
MGQRIPATPAVGPGPAGPPAPGADSHLGMPIRVPQANLARQLRPRLDRDQPLASPPAGQAAEIDDRSPETTRNLMLRMQQGWERGRIDDLDEPAGAPDDGTQR